jgi:hypothetical protein
MTYSVIRAVGNGNKKKLIIYETQYNGAQWGLIFKMSYR